MENDEIKKMLESEILQPDSQTENGDNTKNKKSHNVIAKVLCALAAVVLWFYVVGTDTAIEEKKFSDVSVEIRGLETLENEYGLSIIGGYDHTVDFTISGPNADISQITYDSLIVYADVSDVTGAGEHSLEIEISLPNGVSVSSRSSNFIQVYVDKKTSVAVPVEVRIPDVTIEKDYIMGTPQPSIESVNVSGPAAELEKISHAEVSLDLGRISKSLTAIGKLVLIDKNGEEITNQYIRLQTGEVSVKIPVYTYKDVPLAVDYKYGYYNASNVSVTVKPASIRIKGEPDVLDGISSVVIAQLDEKSIIEDSTLTTAIMLPDDVENVNGIRTAEIAIKHTGTTTREVVVSNISVLNPGNLNYELESPEITVKFRGKGGMLSLLNQNNVTATIDLGYLNNTYGVVSVPVTVNVSTTLAGNVYEIGEYKMNVTIK